MKNLIVLTIILLSFSLCSAQMKVRPDDYQRHRGFYLSMSGGVNFANMTSKVINKYDFRFKGTGGVFDFKIGAAIKENIILHATLLSSSMSAPQVSSKGKTEKAPSSLTLGEAMIGGGLTYYHQALNIFFSGSIGLGNYTLIDDAANISISTDRGFAMQIKIGKEWWISKRWGLGIAFTYGKTNLNNKPSPAVNELMDSNNFGILFNASLN